MVRHSTEISVIVAESVSDALETPIEELPPLYNMIDLDALDKVISSAETEPTCDITVSFTYSGMRVVVASDDLVYVEPIGGEGSLKNNSVDN